MRAHPFFDLLVALVLGSVVVACGIAPGPSRAGDDQAGVPSADPGSEFEGEDVAGGQSGNEGLPEGTYCLVPQLAMVVARAQRQEESLYTVGVERLLTEEAEQLGLAVGDEWTAPWAPYFTSVRPEVGDQVLVQYITGYHGHPNLRMVPVVEDQVAIQWRGHELTLSLEELAQPDCVEKANAMRWPNEGWGGAGGEAGGSGGTSLELGPGPSLQAPLD